jgi:hypothetical protein
LEKYSNELNYQRQLLLNQISTNLSLEISHINEIVGINDNISKEIKNFKQLKFKGSAIKSREISIKRLMNKEIKFGKKFSLSQLFKYEKILELGEYFKKKQLQRIFIIRKRYFRSKFRKS